MGNKFRIGIGEKQMIGGFNARQKGHWSDCAVHNAPAQEPRECDCGGCDLDAWTEFYVKEGRIPEPSDLEGYQHG